MREMGWEVNFKALAPGSQHASIISLASSTVPLSARTLTYEVWLLNNETTYELTATLNQEVTGEGGSVWHNGRPTASLCSVEDYNALVCNGWNTLNQRGAEIWCFSFLLNSNNSSPLKELAILTGLTLTLVHEHYWQRCILTSLVRSLVRLCSLNKEGQPHDATNAFLKSLWGSIACGEVKWLVSLEMNYTKWFISMTAGLRAT